VAVLDDAPGVLVDDRDAAVAHDVVDVAPEQHVRVQRAVELGQQRRFASTCRLPQPSSRSTRRAGLGQLDVAAVLVGS
jgi:hypothetical protein